MDTEPQESMTQTPKQECNAAVVFTLNTDTHSHTLRTSWIHITVPKTHTLFLGPDKKSADSTMIKIKLQHIHVKSMTLYCMSESPVLYCDDCPPHLVKYFGKI